MMKHYKLIKNGYLVLIGIGAIGDEITESEYNIIKDIIRNKPIAPDGYGNRLTESLKWELYELPNDPIEADETTELEQKEQDYDILIGEDE